MLAAIFSQLNYLSVLVAAVAAWVFGALWYRVFGGRWSEAQGWGRPANPGSAAPPVATLALSFVAELIMAAMLFGIIHHIGEATVERALFSAVMIWVGFVATTLTVNYRYGLKPWSLIVIDAAHWLGVLLLMGLVIGLFGG